MRLDGLAKLDIEVKSDWLLICFTSVTKSPGIKRVNYVSILVSW